MTGMLTASMIPSIIDGSLMRATPPAARMSAGTRSSAMTATAPASSAILAWSGVTTSMMTPPLSIWARPFLVAQVDVSTVMWAGFLWLVALGSPAGSGPGVVARSSRPSPARAADYRTRCTRSWVARCVAPASPASPVRWRGACRLGDPGRRNHVIIRPGARLRPDSTDCGLACTTEAKCMTSCMRSAGPR